VAASLELTFDLGSLDPQAAEDACWACGASAVTFVDARDDAVLEPLPGEFRLWPRTRLKCLFVQTHDAPGIRRALGAALSLDPALIGAQQLPERVWEREWLKDSHPLRFGQRLWVCPHHERVSEPGAVVVALDPGLAFGTGNHPTTQFCLNQLVKARAARTKQAFLDIGTGSGPEMAFTLKGVPEIGIAAMADAPYAIVLAVLKDGPKSVDELKGKTVSVSSTGSLTDWLGQNLSRQQGWGIDGFKRAPLGTTAAQTAALKTRQIDGMIVEANGGYRLEEDGSGGFRVRVARGKGGVRMPPEGFAPSQTAVRQALERRSSIIMWARPGTSVASTP